MADHNLSSPRVVALIQARLGSSRLPGKVMMEISGKSMLEHVIGRLKPCQVLDDIVVVTTEESKDDPLEQFCHLKKIACYRGSENDVLDRYYQAALKFKADVIVRITSDCPLIDAGVVGRIVEAYLSHWATASGASNAVERTYPRGLDTEVVSFAALKKAWELADQPYQREHVTVFIYEHPELFKMIAIKNDQDLSALRWTVDEADDLRFVKEVYSRMKQEGYEEFNFSDVLNLIQKHPELSSINAKIKQKTTH